MIVRILCQSASLLAVASHLASVFSIAIEAERKKNASFKPNVERATLLILERTFDLASPLMHELTFEVRVLFIYLTSRL